MSIQRHKGIRITTPPESNILKLYFLHGVNVTVRTQQVLVDVSAGDTVPPNTVRYQLFDIGVEVAESWRRRSVIGSHAPHNYSSYEIHDKVSLELISKFVALFTKLFAWFKGINN